MFRNPIFSVLGPKDIAGWVMRYLALFFGVVSVVLVYDLADNRQFAGVGAVINNVVRLGLPSTILLSLCMAAVIQMRFRMIAEAGADPKTGLLQRHAFLERFGEKISQRGVLMLMDIDRLAKINEGYGLKTGDSCLLSLAMRVRECAGRAGVAGRTDGATIGLFLPGVAMEDAREMATQLSEGIQVGAGERGLSVTVSVGLVGATPENGVDLALVAAEEALLRAKAQGTAQVKQSDGRLAVKRQLKVANA